MKAYVTLALLAACSISMAQQGIFTHTADIGNPALKGSLTYHKPSDTYSLTGGGYNIWFTRDEFFYAFNNITGDFILTAQVQLEGKGKDAHRKIGWMVRADTTSNAAHISAVVHGDGLTVLQWRRAKGEVMRDPEQEIFAKLSHAQTIQLERKGEMFIMRAALKKGSLEEVGRTDNIEMPDRVCAGLILCSHDPHVLETGTARHVSIKNK